MKRPYGCWLFLLVIVLAAGCAASQGSGTAAKPSRPPVVVAVLDFRNDAVNPELDRQSRTNFQEGVVDYLKSDLDQAQRRFEEAASIDAEDPDTQFHLAMIYKRKGMHKAAKKAFKRSLALDPEKWAWEIRKELKEL